MRLKAIDAAHIYAENSVDFPNVVDVWVFDTSADRAVLADARSAIAWLRGRIDCDPVFRRRLLRVPLDLDFPLWADDPEFDIEKCVTSSMATGQGPGKVGDDRL